MAKRRSSRSSGNKSSEDFVETPEAIPSPSPEIDLEALVNAHKDSILNILGKQEDLTLLTSDELEAMKNQADPLVAAAKEMGLNLEPQTDKTLYIPYPELIAKTAAAIDVIQGSTQYGNLSPKTRVGLAMVRTFIGQLRNETPKAGSPWPATLQEFFSAMDRLPLETFRYRGNLPKRYHATDKHMKAAGAV